MKRMILGIALALVSAVAFAGQVWVNGYYRKDGTYVQGHYRTTPDSDQSNNYGRPSAQDRRDNTSPYPRDQDGDGISNQYDYDDDNDGISDQYDNN